MRRLIAVGSECSLGLSVYSSVRGLGLDIEIAGVETGKLGAMKALPFSYMSDVQQALTC
jgi:hypothetical protein